MTSRTRKHRRTLTIAAVATAAVAGVGVGAVVATGDPVRSAEAVRLDTVVVGSSETPSPSPQVSDDAPPGTGGSGGAPTDTSSSSSGAGTSDSSSSPSAPSSSRAATSDGSTASGSPESSTRTITVDGLQQVSGILVRDDDFDDWYVAGIDLDFGPDRWLLTAGPTADFDGDGTAEPLLAELEGLRGRETTFGVRFDADEYYDDSDGYGYGDDGDRDAYVFTIAGRIYWDPAGPAPWTTGTIAGTSATAEPASGGDPGVTAPVGTPVAAGEITREAAMAAAEAALGPGAVAVDVWEEFDDAYRWEIDVLATDGREYDVWLDAAGRVLDVRLD